jgi:RAQPRD family integrative conjugative element protein
MKVTLLLLTLISLFSTCAIASETEEKMYLVQMINQLNAMKPLIIAADKEQPKNVRIKFHYTAYHDSNGHAHNGLLEDINAIQKGIQEKMNQTGTEPRHFQIIKGDYMESPHVN